jgi:hypothetical protein
MGSIAGITFEQGSSSAAIGALSAAIGVSKALL